jgi:biopolymer transport protein ExbB
MRLKVMTLILFAEAATDAEHWYNSGVMWYMDKGGFFMWPILLLAIVALGVVIERYRSLRMLTTDNQILREEVLELMHAGRVEEALDLCNKSRGPEAAILSVGLRKFLLLQRLNYDAGKIDEHVDKAMDDYGVHIVAALERHLPILATIASVAPMLGSVGTVVGMVILFQDLAVHTGGEIIKVAAAGIRVKLIVTVWGLLVGIPAYVAFNYFTTIIHRYVLQVEETATELIEAVTLRLAKPKPSEGSVNGTTHDEAPASLGGAVKTGGLTS